MGRLFCFPRETLVAYLEDKADIELRDKLVGLALPLVERTACLLIRRQKVWVPAHLDVEELYSEGLAGLTRTVERFNPPVREDLPKSFGIHVSRRTWWKLLDFIRKERSVSRTTLDYALRFKTAFEKLNASLGYAPTLEEVAEALRVSVQTAGEWRVLAMELDAQNVSIDRDFVNNPSGKNISLHDVLWIDGGHADEERVLDFTDLLPQSLSDVERAIVISIYRDNRTMLEIGSAFGFSESRISQMFADILLRIRAAYFKRLRRENGESYEK